MGTFKLGKMTFGSLFKQPETIKYPFETKPQPLGLKGHIVIDVDRCILCGMCDRNCSTDCIKVDKKERTWQINAFACVQCGYCVTVCPKDCLAMDPNYTPVSTLKNSECYNVPEQRKEAKPAADAKSKPAPTISEQVKQAQEQPEEPSVVLEQDKQLEALLDLMEKEKADKVKEALAAKR